ncbi:MAG: hypothetical protein V2J02_16980 [Pseudomonadales bacterium]|jgi:hypothetical protein|nr:hypothetical protein [Pseudomonadales bacterium]
MAEPRWRRSARTWLREAVGVLDAAEGLDWSAFPEGLPADLEGVTLADLEAFLPTEADGPVRDAALLVASLWHLSRQHGRGDVDAALTALLDASDRAVELHASVAFPEHAGWLRWDEIAADARTGMERRWIQARASEAAAERHRLDGDLTALRVVEAARRNLRNGGEQRGLPGRIAPALGLSRSQVYRILKRHGVL